VHLNTKVAKASKDLVGARDEVLTRVEEERAVGCEEGGQEPFKGIAEFERKKVFTFQVKTEEHASGMPRHARPELSAGLKESFVDIPARKLMFVLSLFCCIDASCEVWKERNQPQSEGKLPELSVAGVLVRKYSC
jgi:hypothetical protein